MKLILAVIFLFFSSFSQSTYFLNINQNYLKAININPKIHLNYLIDSNKIDSSINCKFDTCILNYQYTYDTIVNKITTIDSGKWEISINYSFFDSHNDSFNILPIIYWSFLSGKISTYVYYQIDSIYGDAMIRPGLNNNINIIFSGLLSYNNDKNNILRYLQLKAVRLNNTNDTILSSSISFYLPTSNIKSYLSKSHNNNRNHIRKSYLINGKSIKYNNTLKYIFKTNNIILSN